VQEEGQEAAEFAMLEMHGTGGSCKWGGGLAYTDVSHEWGGGRADTDG